MSGRGLVAVVMVCLGVLAPRLACAAERWVTLGGEVTESVFALGRADLVVGVDASSVLPEAAAALPKVGSFHRVSAESVLALRPTRVIASAEARPPEVLDQLAATGVVVERLPSASSLDVAWSNLRHIASLAGRVEQAEAIIARHKATVGSLAALSSPRVIFVYARGAGTMLIGGAGTVPDALIRASKATQAATWEGFRPISSEALVTLAPDVILLTTHGLASLGGEAGLLAVPGVSLTPAGKAARVVTLDDSLLLALGPRLDEAVKALHAAWVSAK